MQPCVGLETVPSVPVTAALDQCACTLDGLLREHLVAEEEGDAYYGKDEVDLGA